MVLHNVESQAAMVDAVLSDAEYRFALEYSGCGNAVSRLQKLHHRLAISLLRPIDALLAAKTTPHSILLTLT